MPLFRSRQQRVGDELDRLHREYQRLAAQLTAHADVAPYPHVADHLRALGAAERDNASALQSRLADLGRRPLVNGGDAIRAGDNAWARLVATLEDYRRLLKKLSELGMRWHDDHPEQAQFLHELKERGLRSRDAIVDLIARSDPHALN